MQNQDTEVKQDKRELEADYSSAGTRFYESRHDMETYPYPCTLQRSINIELDAHDSGNRKIQIKVNDHVTNFEWEGSLKELIAILNPVKSEAQNESGKEAQ